MNLRDKTLTTYNNSAKELAEYFRSSAPRSKYIDLAIKLANSPEQPKILEVGCGDGRDAKEIYGRTANFIGFDISEEMIKLAREYVPEAQFIVGDAVTYRYPKNLDIVFAFASLLHLNKKEVKIVFEKVLNSLRPGGIFYISLKHAPRYTQKLKNDRFGKRLFYFYNSKLIEKLAGKGYKTVFVNHEMRGDTKWLEIALQKVT